MAVTKQKIEERFRVLFPSLNLSKTRMDAIAARLSQKPADDADDTAVDAVITEADGYFPFSEVAKADDRARNAEAKLEKTKTPEQIAAEAEAKKIADEKAAAAQENLDKAPDWFKEFAQSQQKTIEALTGKLADIEAGTVKSSKQQTASQLFEKSETLKQLPDAAKQRWISRIDVDSETPIEDQVKELETEYGTLVQVQADNQDLGGAPPANTLANAEMTDAQADALAGDLLPGIGK